MTVLTIPLATLYSVESAGRLVDLALVDQTSVLGTHLLSTAILDLRIAEKRPYEGSGRSGSQSLLVEALLATRVSLLLKHDLLHKLLSLLPLFHFVLEPLELDLLHWHLNETRQTLALLKRHLLRCSNTILRYLDVPSSLLNLLLMMVHCHKLLVQSTRHNLVS